jgi:hypothetical protein
MDAKAKRILFRTYWSNGWTGRDWRSASPEDFAYAKAQGIMFDPVTWTHDDNVARVQPFRSPHFAQVVGAGFATSLSSRRLEWRSALASWSMLERLPAHAYDPVQSGEFYDTDGNVIGTSDICRTCRDAPPNWQLTAHEADAGIDLNVLSFERELLRAILGSISTIPENATAGRLVRELKPGIPGTAAEHRQLVEILGTAGVLRPAARDRPEHLRSDWGPGGQWRGSDRYDEQRILQLFPTLTGI